MCKIYRKEGIYFMKYGDFFIDTHTHTLMSGHAYHTMQEMIDYACSKFGTGVLCITEHGPAMPGSCHDYYFSNYRVLQENKEFQNSLPITVLFGVEANILNKNGDLDLNLQETCVNECMDIVIASIHNCTFEGIDEISKTQKGIIKAIENPYVHIIGHPDDRDFDYDEIVCAAKQYGKALELNNSSNNPSGFRKGARERDLKMLELCKKNNVFVSLGSDAHCKYDILNFKYLIPILEEVNFPKDLIVNSDFSLLYNLIGKKITLNKHHILY